MNNLPPHLDELAASDDGVRELRPVYIKPGDCLVFYASDEPCHAHRFDGLVTVYMSDEDPSRIVGCKIKGVSKTLKKYGSFGVEIGQRPHSLGFFFMAAGMRPEESEIARHLYNSDFATQRVDLSEMCQS